MPFTPKTWQNSPSTATPLSAAALIDLETRLSGYSDAAAPGSSITTIPAASGTQNLAAAAAGGAFLVTLTGNVTFTVTGPSASRACALDLEIAQDNVGGRSVTWFSGVNWLNGTPLIPQGAGQKLLVSIVSFDGGVTWYGTSTSASAPVSGVIGFTAYDPGTTMNEVAPGAATDLNANLAVTFVAPASGKVAVRLEASCNGVASQSYFWSLRESTTDLSGTAGMVVYASAIIARRALTVPVLGLTPGSSHTYKWAHYRTTSGTCNTYAGTGHGPATMTVMALP